MKKKEKHDPKLIALASAKSGTVYYLVPQSMGSDSIDKYD